jgi:hypothetical protein
VSRRVAGADLGAAAVALAAEIEAAGSASGAGHGRRDRQRARHDGRDVNGADRRARGARVDVVVRDHQPRLVGQPALVPPPEPPADACPIAGKERPPGPAVAALHVMRDLGGSGAA